MEIVRRIRWSVGVLAFMLISCAFAAENGVTNEPKSSMLLSPVQKRMQQEISIDFKETPIDDVLMIMAKQADVDIIKSPQVEGTVTATLTDVPLDEALTNILQAHGYAYITTDNMIRVVLQDDIFEVREKIMSEIFTITYADVTEVEIAVKKFISDQGAIAANPGTSNIIVTDVESKMKAIKDFIRQIDRVTPQILVEAMIYDISSKDNLDLGIEWQMGTRSSYMIGDESFVNGDAIKILGNSDAATKTEPFITSLLSGVTGKTVADGMLRFGFTTADVRLDAILHASQEDIRAKLLANPRILVLDNELAEIKIVEEIPYQELTQSEGGGNIGTTAFRDVGVELRVTPHLTRDGLIRMQLNPKFSIRTGDVVVGGLTNASPQPVIATREETTTALVKDGQTVVIGGLKKKEVSQQVNKVPLLGDLPLLGGLFRFEGESTTNSELLIFITPSVVIEPKLNESEAKYLAEAVFTNPTDTYTTLEDKAREKEAEEAK